MQLTIENVLAYLAELILCDAASEDASIELMPAKNFNLLISLPGRDKLLVKQERRNQDGQTANEFKAELHIQNLVSGFDQLASLKELLPIVRHFDEQQSIIVFQFLDRYSDLSEFYTKERVYPAGAARNLGKAIAQIHRLTSTSEIREKFLIQQDESRPDSQTQFMVQGLQRIGPEVFGMVPADGLKFFTLYQRYNSLGQAVGELSDSLMPSCVIHNDLKLNNVLLADNWQEQEQSIRLIDWERCEWGDPAWDLGSAISSYLQMWLGSMVISQALSIEESLRLATIPLERLQPSIFALTEGYLDESSDVLGQRPDFLKRVVQFSGLALIQQIQAMIQYQKSFGNMGIAMLQVAKSLLCRPEASMPTLFGEQVNALVNRPVAHAYS